jgi:threonine-phosphate decarboxylase
LQPAFAAVAGKEKALKEYPHGGDRLSFYEKNGIQPIDFSANINPLGMPPLAKIALEQAVKQDSFADYPDPHCRKLTAALSQKLSIDPQMILCGNGAAELIYRICLCFAPQHALLVQPTFSEYEQALRQSGCSKIDYHFLRPEEHFLLTDAILPLLTPKLDLLFLCHPNNPTGQLIPDDLLLAIADKCRENGILLVVDECFLEFTGRESVLQARLADGNLILLRAFTKFYAMAGLRLGYLLAAPHLVARLETLGQPWSVSTPAQIAGIAALQQPDFAAQTRKYLASQRKLLVSGLQQAGIKVLSGEANYLFLQADSDFADRLAAKGILVRSCSNYPGLNDSYYRIAVRTEAENLALLAALEKGGSQS